jgi:hypothetical protein
MKEPVEASGGSLREILALDEHNLEAPHCHVARDPRPGRTAPDYQNFSLQLRHK